MIRQKTAANVTSLVTINSIGLEEDEVEKLAY